MSVERAHSALPATPRAMSISEVRPRIPAPLHGVLALRELPLGKADAMLAIARLLRSGETPAEVFLRLTHIVDRAVGVRAVAIAARAAGEETLIWRRRDAGIDEDQVQTVLDGSVGYFQQLADGADALATCADQCWISLPVLSAGGTAVGVVAVAPDRVPMDEGSVALVAAVAGYLAEMLARLEKEREIDAEALEPETDEAAATLMRQTVFDLTLPLISGFEPVESLRHLASTVAARVASGCVVNFLLDDAMRRVGHISSRAEDLVEAALAPVVAGVMRSGKPATAAALSDARRTLGMDWLICVPLATPTAVLGAITFMGRRHQHAPVPLALAEELGHRAAGALENAARYNAAQRLLGCRERALAMVSHELKNPLGVILMGASRVLEQTPRVERRQAGRREVEAILRSARRMKALVADLLDLSAIDAGHFTMKAGEISLDHLMSELLADVGPQAAAGGIALEQDVPATLPKVWADPNRVTQVIGNLVGNAIKFTGRGGCIRASARLLSSDEVEISIADNGPGIEPGDLPHVFDRYWQALETASQGTGLGLAISKSIIEASGGRMAAHSELGRGTSMTFTLRVARDQLA